MFDEHGTLVGQPAYLENPGRYDAFKATSRCAPPTSRASASWRRSARRCRPARAWGRSSWAGRCGCRTSCWPWPSIPSWAAASAILAAEVSLKRLGNYVASLSSADTDVALTDGRARLIAAASRGRRRQPRAPFACRARARASRRPAPWSPSTCATGGASSAPTRRSPAGGWGRSSTRPSTPRCCRSTGSAARRCSGSGSRRSSGRSRRASSRGGSATGWRRWRRLAPDRGRQPGGAHRAGLQRRARRSGDGVQQDGRRPRGGAPEDHAADRRDHGLEPDAGEARRGEDDRAAPGAGPAAALALARRARASSAPASRTRSTTRSPARWASRSSCIADLPADHPARPLVQDLENEALRIRKIVQNMLRFAQRQSGQDTTPVDLARTLDDAVELCGPSDLAAPASRSSASTRATPPVRGSATQLQESFIQLIQNARSAMKKGGTLTLETSLIEDKLVRVRIGDTGPGISAEHLPRIFDPFFTTKGDRSGTGLGLSFVHQTIEDHGGTIKVESSVGRGTTFRSPSPPTKGGRTGHEPGAAQPQARQRRRLARASAVGGARRREPSSRADAVSAIRGRRRRADGRWPATPSPAAARARGRRGDSSRSPRRRGRSRPSATGTGSPIQHGDLLTRDDVVRTAAGGARRPAPVGRRRRSSCARRSRSASIAWPAAPASICAAARWSRACSGSDGAGRSPRATRAPPTKGRRTSWCWPTSAAGSRSRRSRARRGSRPAASPSPSPQGRRSRSEPGAAPERSRADPRGGPAGGGLAGGRAAARRQRDRGAGARRPPRSGDHQRPPARSAPTATSRPRCRCATGKNASTSRRRT